MAEQPLLSARAIRKVFRTPAMEVTVLDGIDLDLYAGEMTALLGASGAGKSTLMQILGTLEQPTSGQVLLEDRDLFALSDGDRAGIRNRHIGFVYQFHYLLPEFTALDNVAMPLRIGRMEKGLAREKAMAVLREVGLEHRAHHRPMQLSGGEQQRVAIARAVVTEPVLLLADEPTGNLDHKNADGVMALLREINRARKLSCLLVTHNLELAAAMDRRLHLLDGKLVRDDRGEARLTA